MGRWLGKSVPLSLLRCGNIDPIGITGTPVIDESTASSFLDAMVDGSSGPRHLVFGISLRDELTPCQAGQSHVVDCARS